MPDTRRLRPDPASSTREAGSIREPGAAPRGPRPETPSEPVSWVPPAARTGGRIATRSVPTAREPRRRPDPNPLRLMFGVAGLASAAALTTAMLPSITPQADASAADQGTGAVTAAVAPQPSVQHVTRYVTLQPGQTAPPQSTVIVQPQPTPVVTVRVVTKTRQSGRP